MAIFSDSAWSDMTPAVWYARNVAESLHRELFRRELVVTSGRRPATPGGSSRHETGNAMDIRSRDKSAHEEEEFARVLRERLGEDFDVIVEGPFAADPRYRNRTRHVHVEYDPKGRHAVMADE